MIYIVKYRESCKTINMVTATVEADSEQEAKQLIKEGMGDVEDCYEIDSYDNEILRIEDIQEDPDYDEK